MGDRTKKFHFTISITKENKNVTFKVGNTSKTGSATVDLANDEESTLTEIPVGAMSVLQKRIIQEADIQLLTLLIMETVR